MDMRDKKERIADMGKTSFWIPSQMPEAAKGRIPKVAEPYTLSLQPRCLLKCM
jgi:hypothetical protein